jgi:hypothetical protein
MRNPAGGRERCCTRYMILWRWGALAALWLAMTASLFLIIDLYT